MAVLIDDTGGRRPPKPKPKTQAGYPPGYHPGGSPPPKPKPQNAGYAPHYQPSGGYTPPKPKPLQQQTWPYPTAPAPRPPVQAPRAPSGGGGGGVPTGGGGGGGAPSPLPNPLPTPAPVTPAAPKMETVNIPDAEADPNYLLTVATLRRALNDYNATQTLQRNQYNRTFNTAENRMGYVPQGSTGARGWSSLPLQGAYGQARALLGSDMASRGVGFSGINDYNMAQLSKDFNDRLNSLVQDRRDYLDTQNRSLLTYQHQQDDTRKAALENAVTRIAQRLALQTSQVPRGTGATTIRRPVA